MEKIEDGKEGEKKEVRIRGIIKVFKKEEEEVEYWRRIGGKSKRKGKRNGRGGKIKREGKEY